MDISAETSDSREALDDISGGTKLLSAARFRAHTSIRLAPRLTAFLKLAPTPTRTW